MSGKLTIVSYFVCPYCYWLEALLDRLEGRRRSPMRPSS